MDLEEKTPDKFDRYRAHLLEGKRLNEKEAGMLRKYRQANTLLCQGLSKHQTVKMLTRDTEVSESQAYMIIRDAIKLYGDATLSDKAGMKHLMYENFMRAAQLAKKAKDFQSHIRALENAAKVSGAYAEINEGFDLQAFMQMLPVNFTTDPSVLQKSKPLAGPDTYTDFEELDDMQDAKEE